MKYAVAAAILAAVVKAQTIDDVPECAVPCLDDAIASETSCDTTDYACVCENFESVQGVATACVIEECGATVALNEVLPAVEALCAAQGGDDSEEPEETTTVEVPEETTTVEVPEETTTVEVPEETTTVEVPEETETVVVPTEEPTMEEPTETVIETTIQTTLTSTVCEYGCGEATTTPTPVPTPEEPETPEQPPQNAAGALAPLGGLVLAVAAFAL